MYSPIQGGVGSEVTEPPFEGLVIELIRNPFVVPFDTRSTSANMRSPLHHSILGPLENKSEDEYSAMLLGDVHAVEKVEIFRLEWDPYLEGGFLDKCKVRGVKEALIVQKGQGDVKVITKKAAKSGAEPPQAKSGAAPPIPKPGAAPPKQKAPGPSFNIMKELNIPMGGPPPKAKRSGPPPKANAASLPKTAKSKTTPTPKAKGNLAELLSNPMLGPKARAKLIQGKTSAPIPKPCQPKPCPPKAKPKPPTILHGHGGGHGKTRKTRKAAESKEKEQEIDRIQALLEQDDFDRQRDTYVCGGYHDHLGDELKEAEQMEEEEEIMLSKIETEEEGVTKDEPPSAPTKKRRYNLGQIIDRCNLVDVTRVGEPLKLNDRDTGKPCATIYEMNSDRRKSLRCVCHRKDHVGTDFNGKKCTVRTVGTYHGGVRIGNPVERLLSRSRLKPP